MKYFSIITSALIISASFSILGANAKVIGHRGAASVAPENTLASFQQAADFRADYFELDVYLSKDDSLVIIHDKSVNRTTDGSGFVTLLTFAQLREFDAGSWFDAQFAGEKIPTLKEALLLGKENNTGVCVEIKGNKAGIVEKTVNLIQTLGMETNVVILSFSFEQISLAKQIDPTIPVLYLMDNISTDKVDRAAEINALALGVENSVKPEMIDYCRQKNVEVWIWTIDSAAEMSALMALGVDGIITNYPQLLRGILEDDTPPSDVTLAEASVAGTTVSLKWRPAEDADSDIAGYEIYRDTTAHAAKLYKNVANLTALIDETLMESTTFYYRVKALNYAGLTSANFSNELSVTTETDTQPPEIAAVKSCGAATTVFVEFNERVNPGQAADVASFEISGVQITAAVLSLDEKTVMLTTSPLTDGAAYDLTVLQMTDQAASPNAALNLGMPFHHYSFPAGLVAAWRMDEGAGDSIEDISGNDNRGDLVNDVMWSSGHLANGLHFDGQDDYVQLPTSESLDINAASVTLSAWVKLLVPPGDLPGAYGPIYDSDQDSYVLYEDKANKELRFKVTTTSGAERPGIKEEDLPLGEWLHLVGVYDGARAMIYLNGTLMDEHAGLSGRVKTGQQARLGENKNLYFQGGIDDIQVYHRALNEEEINMLYWGKETSTGVARYNITADCALVQNYPNPFNPMTTIRYRVPVSGFVELAIYNILGHKVRTLVRDKKSAGSYAVVWDGKDNRGKPAASGVYFYQLKTGQNVQRQRMILAR